jgi:hypothetical protein
MLERTTNVAVIAGVILFFAVVARDYLKPHRNYPEPPSFTDPQTAAREAVVGKPLSAPGLTFPRERPTVVLALSTGCHFCRDSESFYRQLSTRASGKVDVVAVFPQALPEAKAYAHDHIPAVMVLSAPLSSIHVMATPTVLLISRNGKVQDAWVGRLSEPREREVLSRILSTKD